jgi:curved DNA-binding protein CbpA
MKKLRIVLFILASLIAASVAQAQTLDWQAVEKLSPRSWISVETQKRTQCEFEKATSDELFCHINPEDWLSGFSGRYSEKRQVRLLFRREDVREVRTVPFDYSQGPLSLLLAAGGGGGFDSAHQPNSFAGIKIGGPFSLDLHYDRIQGHSGFSAEGSAVVPLFRVPRFQVDKEIKFVKVYAEPGLGYRAGGGTFGGYSSAKVLAVVLTDTWSDKWVAPYVEFQRRFPFNSPLQGDNRLTIGVMTAFCEHCGID